MRNLVAQFVVLVAIFAPTAARAQNATSHSNQQAGHFIPPQIPGLRGLRNSPRDLAVRSAIPPRLPASAAPAIVSATCPPDGVGAVCGYLPVPFDWNHPHGAQIQIFFELFPHSNPGPAESAILANFGGPAVGTTTAETFFASQILFWSNLDAHDLLLIDDRGSGLSNTIDCEDLQHGITPFDQEETSCAAQLGSAATRYGSGDVARDMEAVREALGYDKVDYFGASYGGYDVAAYATRFGKHLRSIVLDAPGGTPGQNVLTRLQFRTHADPRMVQLDCQRSPICSVDHPNPVADLNQLIQAVRNKPVEGDSFDLYGNPVHVRIDEDGLLNFVVTYPRGVFSSTGEILAAGSALKQGDPAPLLRLGAEGLFTVEGDYGDPTFNSAGDFFARVCVDAQEAWEWSDPVSERQEEYNETVSGLPANYFAPFSKAAATGILFSDAGQQCIWWEKPTPSSPVVPEEGRYPRVPTLVLDGDLDNRVPLEESNKVAALFPGSIALTVQEAGHETVGYTFCAQSLVSEFIENLALADTSCVNTPETVWPAVGRFPLLAKNARAAEVDPTGGNQVGQGERKVATVAVATAIDSLQRFYMGFGSDGVGLRAGTWHLDFGDTGYLLTLTNSVFASDVTVNGTVLWGYDTSFTADLTVSGNGTAGGTLHISGTWLASGPVGNFAVSGTLGGKNVAVLVPEA